LSYYITNWDDEHIKPLEKVLRKSLIHAERYGDKVMLFYVKLLLNLTLARMKLIAIEV